MRADSTTSATSASSASTRTARSGTRSPSAARRATPPRSARSSAPRLPRTRCRTSWSGSSMRTSRTATTTSDSSTPCSASASSRSRSASMSQLIKQRVVTDDRWTVVREATVLADLPDGVPVIVPLALWIDRRAALIARGEVGVWLAPAEDPAAVAADTGRLAVIAIDFPQFTDGRGYSHARLLRERYGYTGELRAIGDVQRDQLYYLTQCGFDAFAIRD